MKLMKKRHICRAEEYKEFLVGSTNTEEKGNRYITITFSVEGVCQRTWLTLASFLPSEGQSSPSLVWRGKSVFCHVEAIHQGDSQGWDGWDHPVGPPTRKTQEQQDAWMLLTTETSTSAFLWWKLPQPSFLTSRTTWAKRTAQLC